MSGTGRRMRNALIAVAVAGSVTATMSAPVAAAAETTRAAATAADFAASYQSGLATGTAYRTYTGLITTLFVNGTLTSTNADCYRVQLLVRQDLVTTPVDVADQCGAGAKPFSVQRSTFSPATTGFGIRVCRVESGTVTGCGSSVVV